MNLPAAFVAPEPLALAIDTPLPPGQAVTRLERAVGDRVYSQPGRSSPGFFRLGGSVSQERLTVTARPYVVPGLIAGFGAMTIELRGEVIPINGGSGIRGTVSAPVGKRGLAFLGVSLIVWIIFGVASNGLTLPTGAFFVLGGIAMSAIWARIMRHNQRMALRNVGELQRMLEAAVVRP